MNDEPVVVRAVVPPGAIVVSIVYDRTTEAVSMEANTKSHVILLGLLELMKLTIEQERARKGGAGGGIVVVPRLLSGRGPA